MEHKNTTTVCEVEQRRAVWAYERVKKAREELDSENVKYKSYVKDIPMKIRINGLASTLCFIKARARKSRAYELLEKQIREYLTDEKHQWLFEKPVKQDDDLFEMVISQKSTQYRAITTELLMLFTWLKRFVEGLIEGDEEDVTDEE